jgi:hypothetical protein
LIYVVDTGRVDDAARTERIERPTRQPARPPAREIRSLPHR